MRCGLPWAVCSIRPTSLPFQHRGNLVTTSDMKLGDFADENIRRLRGLRRSHFSGERGLCVFGVVCGSSSAARRLNRVADIARGAENIKIIAAYTPHRTADGETRIANKNTMSPTRRARYRTERSLSLTDCPRPRTRKSSSRSRRSCGWMKFACREQQHHAVRPAREGWMRRIAGAVLRTSGGTKEADVTYQLQISRSEPLSPHRFRPNGGRHSARRGATSLAWYSAHRRPPRGLTIMPR